MAIQKPFVVIPHQLGTLDGIGNQKTARPASHVGEFKNPGMVWETTGSTNCFIRGDFGTPRDVDFIALLGTNATATTTTAFRMGDTAAEVNGTADYDSGSRLIRNPAISRDDGVYHSHFELPSMVTKQWWRIDVNNHTGDFRCMAIIMGFKRQFADFYSGGQSGVEYGFDDMADISLGNYGVVEETDGIMLRTLGMTFEWMSEADRVNKFAPVTKALGKRGVALWCFDPEATIYRQDKTYFGWLQELPVFKPTTWKQDRWTAPFNIISMI